MIHDNFSILDTASPIPKEKAQHIIATIGNYAKVTFAPVPDNGIFYSQFILATVSPLPDALIQFEPFECCNVLAESIEENINNPRALIHLLLELREHLIEKQYMPSYHINVTAN